MHTSFDGSSPLTGFGWLFGVTTFDSLNIFFISFGQGIRLQMCSHLEWSNSPTETAWFNIQDILKGKICDGEFVLLINVSSFMLFGW